MRPIFHCSEILGVIYIEAFLCMDNIGWDESIWASSQQNLSSGFPQSEFQISSATETS